MSDRADTVVPVIIGTAGHVDHGKTSLVQLLTGCDTDRLKAEKERGLTIDLGFAPCRFPGRRLAGIVDVPGHRDFIRNMVAGAASIDVLLLVVAADDGVMPQTREHLQIVGLLRTPRVLVALTKTDLVEPEMLALVTEELAGFLAEAGYPDAPILPVSNKTGEGITAVRATLEAMVAAVDRRPDDRAFRLFVERSFSVPGHGTVVTGIPVSGELRPGDEVALWPQSTRHVVRGIQNYKLDSRVARPGVCAAINLRDCDQANLARGQCIADPAAYAPARELVVAVDNVADRPWTSNRGLRLHLGTAAVAASLRLLAERIDPGTTGFARLVLDQPLVATAGDRFVLRESSPDATVGGGVVLSVRGHGVRQDTGAGGVLLEAAREAVDSEPFRAELLAGAAAVLGREELRRLTRLPEAAAQAAVDAALAAGHLLPLGPETCVVARREAALLSRLTGVVTRFLEAHPLAWGMKPAAAAEACGLPPSAAVDLLRLATGHGALTKRHGRLGLADREPQLTAKQIKAYEALAAAVAESGVNGLAAGPAGERCGIAKGDFKLLGQLLAEEGSVVRLGQHLFPADAIEACRAAVRVHFTTRERLSLAEFREATGASRNQAVVILEQLDNEGLTRRDGDARVPR